MERILIFRKRSKKTIGFSGGGEIGIDKLEKQLKTLGYYVHEQPLPYLEGKLPYLYFIISFIKVFAKAILGHYNKFYRFHVSVYFGSSRLFEVILLVLLRIFNRKKIIVLEIRGGYIQNTGKGFWAVRISRLMVDKIVSQVSFDNSNLKFDGILPNFYELDGVYERKITDIIELGYLGRIEKNKGIAELIKVCRILKEKGIKYRCQIAGNGSKAEWLQKTIFQEGLSNEVVYLENVSRDRVSSFWSKIDYFVFLTTNPYEGQSNSLTEAIVAGVIPLVSDIPAMKSTIAMDSLNFHQDDVHGVIKRIQQFQNDSLFKADVQHKLANLDFSKKEFIRSLNMIYEC